MINWQTLGLENPYPRIVAAFKANPRAVKGQFDPADYCTGMDDVYKVSCVAGNWKDQRETLDDSWDDDDNSGYEEFDDEITQYFELIEEFDAVLKSAGIIDGYSTTVKWDKKTGKIIYIDPGHVY